jgi:signal transduction histidine kinase
VRGDADALAQLLGNLVQNAVDASPEGASVYVSIRRTKAAVRVEILDEGPGIPPEVRARIYEPFLTTKRGGIGLGLSICREIAASHHADLQLDAGRQGRGTCATVSFAC